MPSYMNAENSGSLCLAASLGEPHPALGLRSASIFLALRVSLGSPPQQFSIFISPIKVWIKLYTRVMGVMWVL